MKLKYLARNRKVRFATLVLLLGASGLVYAQASRPSLKFEAEQGVISGQASVSTDTAASNGSYLLFNVANPPSGVQFSEDFSTSGSLDRFEWQVFHGGVNPIPRSDQPRSWHGDHDMNCGAPTTLRDVNLIGEVGPGPVSSVGNVVWWCAPGSEAAKGHVMTSMSLVAYGSIDFAPKQTFNNITKVCWDMNRTEMGGRKWAQVTVIPESVYQANGRRLDYVQLNLQGDVAVNGEKLEDGAFMLSTFRSALDFQVGGPNAENFGDDTQRFELEAAATGSDKATRLKHCLSDTSQGVRMTIHYPDGREMTDFTSNGLHLPDGQVRVIFQDATYDSIKGDMSFEEAQRTNTWHWDNIIIE